MNIALILSGGTGTRLRSDVPKQYMEVGGKPIIAYCLETLLVHEEIGALQIVAEPLWQEQILKWIEKILDDLAADRRKKGNQIEREVIKKKFEQKFRGFSLPGENRQLSILHGLSDLMTYEEIMPHEKITAYEGITLYEKNTAYEDFKNQVGLEAFENSKSSKKNGHGVPHYVLIHDAARPLLSAKLITDCLNGAMGHDGAMPVLPMKDTVYFSEDGKTVKTLLNRSRIYAGQAPEVFRLDKYYEANRRLLPDKILQINGSTEPAILAGMDIVMIPGEEDNFKITTRADLERFQAIVDI